MPRMSRMPRIANAAAALIPAAMMRRRRYSAANSAVVGTLVENTAMTSPVSMPIPPVWQPAQTSICVPVLRPGTMGRL